MGFTDECDIGHYVKRALVHSARGGNAEWHLHRLSGLLESAIDGDVATTEGSNTDYRRAHTG